MSPIRVVLADMPRLLSDIVSTVLDGAPDVQLRRTTSVVPFVLGDVADHADVVILAEEETPMDHYAQLLFAHPTLRVVAISGDGRDATVYDLRPHRQALGELSSDTLLRAVRTRSTAHGESR